VLRGETVRNRDLVEESEEIPMLKCAC